MSNPRTATSVAWFIFTSVFAIFTLCTVFDAEADEQVVYSIYAGVNLGNPGEQPRKDYYVNVGSSQGINVGSTLEVIRRMPTYDLVSEKLYRDMAFPIAHLKVIHVETTAAIARLEKFFPADKTPTIQPRAVMVGDFVRRVR